MEREKQLLTNEEKRLKVDEERMAYVEEREFMPDPQVTPGEVTVETRMSNNLDEDLVNKGILENLDKAVGSRNEFKSYRGKETLAKCLERGKKGLTGNGKEAQIERKREGITLDNQK